MSISFVPLASSSLGCAYLVQAEGHAPLLLDCGLPYAELQRKLWEHEVNVSDLAGCLISHGHQDHCKAAAKLMEHGVDCYASEPVLNDIGAWDHHRGRCLLTDSNQVHLYEAEYVGRWNVLAFDAVHDASATGFCVSAPDRERPDLGWQMMESGSRLLYLTDSAYCPYRFAGLTHICVEANFSSDIIKENVMAGRLDVEVAKRTIQSHSSIDTVIGMLKANDLSKCQAIYLCHLSRANSNSREFKEAVQRETGVATYVCAEKGGFE